MHQGDWSAQMMMCVSSKNDEGKKLRAEVSDYYYVQFVIFSHRMPRGQRGLSEIAYCNLPTFRSEEYSNVLHSRS